MSTCACWGAVTAQAQALWSHCTGSNDDADHIAQRLLKLHTCQHLAKCSKAQTWGKRAIHKCNQSLVTAAQVRVPAETGKPAPAYVSAAAHGLTDEAERLWRKGLLTVVHRCYL